MFVMVLFVGGMVGSTAGGLKVQRWTLLARAVYREVLRLIHPSRVTSVRILGEPVAGAAVDRFILLGVAWVLLFAGGALALLVGGLDLATSVSSSACAINNVGSGYGATAEHWGGLPAPAKALVMVMMVLGRLEVFAVFAALSPLAWRASR
jgi:trk system potassium uptake protein TrkH